jgi:hypothetical protein
MISKTFDEMTGNGQATTSVVQIYKSGGFFTAKTFINLSFALVVGDGFRQAWILVYSQLSDWAFIGNTQVLALVDGKRHSFEGVVRSTDTAIVNDDVVCQEDFHIGVPEEFLTELGGSTSAKLRIGGSDFEVPAELIADLKEISKAI